MVVDEEDLAAEAAEIGEEVSEATGAEIGVAEVEAVEEDIHLKHTLASLGITRINTDIPIFSSCKEIKGSTRTSIKDTSKMLHSISLRADKIFRIIVTSLRLSKCRETTNRAGSGQTCTGMEEGLPLDHDDDVLQHVCLPRGEETHHRVEGQRHEGAWALGQRG